MTLVPEYVDGAGRRSNDPLELAGPVPAIDLKALALLLAPPVLMGEFTPSCPWQGVERIGADEIVPQPAPLTETFRQAIESLTAEAEVIGVMVSGGLDSLAVLSHAMKVARGRRVVALTTDLTDDAGGSAAAMVKDLLTTLQLPAELVVLDPTRDRAQRRWSPAGPRLDALPEVNAAASALALELGVGVLLSGDGADELLGVPRFAAATILARQGPSAAYRYIRDLAGSGPGALGEVIGLAARFLPAKARARTYWAANWPEWCAPVAPAVLAEPHRSHVTKWAHEWVRQQIEAHTAAGRSWAEADAHDAFYPHDPIPPAGSVQEASPFLDQEFMAAALAIPPADRYDPTLPNAYHRCKAEVVRLLPRESAHLLPKRKQYFTTALARHMPAEQHAPRSVACGLLDRDALAVESDPSVLLVVSAIEQWLIGTEEVVPV